MPQPAAAFGENSDTIAAPSAFESGYHTTFSEVPGWICRVMGEFGIQCCVTREVQEKTRANTKWGFVEFM